jgi:hypothetical protein
MPFNGMLDDELTSLSDGEAMKNVSAPSMRRSLPTSPVRVVPSDLDVGFGHTLLERKFVKMLLAEQEEPGSNII